MDLDGNMVYHIDANKLKGFIGAHISLKNGTDLAQVFNSYLEVNGKSEIPTGEWTDNYPGGVITSDLMNLMKKDSVYVVVRTQAHENGEMQGIVTPSNPG